jgi:hypothetical protein
MAAPESLRIVASPRLLAVCLTTALLLASVLLAALVLPMAHGLAPTGAGRVLGTIRPADMVDHLPIERRDTARILVPAGGELEYKLYLRAGDSMEYLWFAPDELFFDFHGEEQGAPPEEFTSHNTGEAQEDQGMFIAPFTGTHGWYWRSRSSVDLEVTLQTQGTYAVVGIL